MMVKYKNGSIHVDMTEFPYREGDHVTIVIQHLTTKDGDEDIYYRGHITEIEEEREGFWARLEDDQDKEEFFHFGEIEAVLDGYKIPFFGGWTKRNDKT